MVKEKRLSEEDQLRLSKYLQQPIHQVERKPFRPFLLLSIILLIMTGLSLFSYLLAYLHDVV